MWMQHLSNLTAASFLAPPPYLRQTEETFSSDWGAICGAKQMDILSNYCFYCYFLDYMAEEVGFEPTVDFHLRRFSRPVHSTTLPLLRQSFDYWVSEMLSRGWVKIFILNKKSKDLTLCYTCNNFISAIKKLSMTSYLLEFSRHFSWSKSDW